MIMRIELPFQVKSPILACGADMKGAFALAKGREAFLVDGFGDLGDPDNLAKYEKAIKAAIKKLKIIPNIVACDLHPSYFSSQFARNYTLYAKRYTLCKIQHHEAHIASAIVDNSIKGDVIGVAFDGTGFGFDENIWGGEFFLGNLKGFIRIAHFEYMPMPGIEMVIKEPWRMAASYLYSAFGNNINGLKIDFAKYMERDRWQILRKMIDKGVNSPLTSSVGRLFDAVASMVLLKKKAKFEAELPMKLEKLAIASCRDSYDFEVKHEEDGLVINVRKVIKGIVKDISADIEKSVISAKFHNTLADIISKVSAMFRKKCCVNKVVLSGGVFQNRYLTKETIRVLTMEGFLVYINAKISTNDSGIPIGQIAIANARSSCA